MKASLIIIGTELTRGIIQDKHAKLVSKELTAIGIHICQIVALPDDGSIESVLEALVAKNDILIITGGLGPTADDMTREVIAKAAGVSLERNEMCWNNLVSRLGSRAYGANEKQAFIPKGFDVIDNKNGTAAGFYGYASKTLLISLPGPPKEMEPMFYDTVLPLLRKKMNLSDEKRDEYSSFLTAEAKLEELCEQADQDIIWATRFQDYKISLYASGKSDEERRIAIEKIRASVGIDRLVDGNVEAIDILIATLLDRNATIACAESCSGGLASSLLTSRPGSSCYMLGSVTSYAPSVKEKVLSVPKDIVDRFGTVSVECAREMACKVRALMDSDYAFSITGVAGPEKSEGKDVGTVCFGFSGRDREACSVKVLLGSWGRESVRRRATVAAFLLMDCYIKNMDIESVVDSWHVF